MLHTLNKAWVKILSNQEDKSFLFVANDIEEWEYIYNELKEIEKTNKIKSSIAISTISNIKFMITFNKFFNEDFNMYDDILISHEIHDVMIKDYLSKYCKRKCC